MSGPVRESGVDALNAAIEFQQAVTEANRDQPEDTRIVFRIGLHLGDLIVDGDDLYGDGVNVAARLESEAPAGGILISRTVHEAWARKCIQQNPHWSASHRQIVASLFLTGRLAEARTATQKYLVVDPKFTVHQRVEAGPFRRTPNQERLFAALRGAGVPE